MSSIFIPESEYKLDNRYWISDSGQYVRDGTFCPDAFDPQAPNTKRRGKHYKLASSGDDLHADPFDLANLLFVDKQKVIDFLAALEEAALVAQREGKMVLPIVSTGGTLTMSRNEVGALVSKLDPKQLILAAGSGISDAYIPVGMELMRIDSSQYEYAYGGDMAIIQSYVWTHASGLLRELMVGFMVPHGTDTKVESCTNLMAQLGPNVPFNAGFVSAQQTMEDKPNDVGTNIYLNSTLLELFKRKAMNAVFMTGGGSSGGALNPAWTKKVDDRKVRAFESNYGPAIADTDDFVVGGITNQFHDRYQHSIGFGTDTRFQPFLIDGYKSVVQITAEVARNPQLVHDTIVSAAERCRGTMGILLTTFGAFTDNNKNLAVVKKLKEQYKLLLFATSPFAQGKKHDYESARRIQQELGGIITRMSSHGASSSITMASRIWPGQLGKIEEFVREWDYAGLQAPIPDDTKGIHFSEIRHLGTPPELVQRQAV